MNTLSVKVSVSRAMGTYWAIAGSGLRACMRFSKVADPEAAKKAAAAYLGCTLAEVTLAELAPGVFTATCSALPEGDL